MFRSSSRCSTRLYSGQNGRLEVPDFALPLQAWQIVRRNLGDLQNLNIAFHEGLLADCLPLLSNKIAYKIWTIMTWAVYDGDVLVMLALCYFLVWRTNAWWRSQSSWCMAGPEQCPKMEAQSWVPQQRCTVGHTDGETGR